MAWNFEEVEPTVWEALPAGTYRVRIKDVEDKVSQAGRDMIVLTLTVSETGHQLKNYLVFNDDTPDTQRMTNQKLTAFFRSFGIPSGEFNHSKWIGKIGVAYVVVEQYDGQDRNNVKAFIEPAKQGNVKGWVEPGAQKASSSASASSPSSSYKAGDPYARPPY